MNIATTVEETLRGLPDQIQVYITWNSELDEPAWWENSPEYTYPFPVATTSLTEASKYIARETIGVMEAVIDGHMELPSSIDTIMQVMLRRNGTIFPQLKSESTMQELVEHQTTQPLNEETFHREFAHYYAGLVAQQRNKQ